jgi:hypothetical protein
MFPIWLSNTVVGSDSPWRIYGDIDPGRQLKSCKPTYVFMGSFTAFFLFLSSWGMYRLYLISGMRKTKMYL